MTKDAIRRSQRRYIKSNQIKLTNDHGGIHLTTDFSIIRCEPTIIRFFFCFIFRVYSYNETNERTKLNESKKKKYLHAPP